MGVVCFGFFFLLLFFSKVPHKKPQKPTKKKQPAAHLPLHNSISAPDPLVTLLVISHDHTSSYNPNTCSFFFFFFGGAGFLLPNFHRSSWVTWTNRIHTDDGGAGGVVVGMGGGDSCGEGHSQQEDYETLKH